jgi:hypothetical protein
MEALRGSLVPDNDSGGPLGAEPVANAVGLLSGGHEGRALHVGATAEGSS